MTEVFKMPDIGEGMAEGEISNWLVKVGDQVKTDDPVAEVQNDKLLQEILSPYDGKVTKLYVDAGTTVKVGDPLIEFDGNGADVQAENKPADSTKQTAAQPAAVSETAVQNSQAPVSAELKASNGNILAMPSVRHLAYENNVDLADVQPTGRHGHITLADLQSYIDSGQKQPAQTVSQTAETAVQNSQAPAASQTQQAAAPTSAPALKEGRVDFTPVRRAIAKAMSHQNETIPTVTNFDQVEVSKLVEHRKHFKQQAADQDIKLTYLAYVVKALAATAKKFPDLNASIDIDKFQTIYHDQINVGVAVNAPSGLFVPVIFDADRKSILTIAKEIQDLAAAVRSGSIKAAQMQGSTITVSNVGSARGSWFTPIINGKEVAILGLGTIAKEPVIDKNGAIVAGQLMKLSLSYDHRLIDGMLGQQALNYLKSLLADPEYMLMEV